MSEVVISGEFANNVLANVYLLQKEVSRRANSFVEFSSNETLGDYIEENEIKLYRKDKFLAQFSTDDLKEELVVTMGMFKRHLGNCLLLEQINNDLKVFKS